MLHQLTSYAQGQELVSEPGFSTKRVHWAVNVANDGQFLGIDDLRDGKAGREYRRCPDLSQPELIGGGNESPRSHYLVESVELLLGYSKKPESDPAKAAMAESRRQKKRAYFIGLLQKSAEDTTALLGLEGACRFLENQEQVELAKAQLIALKGLPTEAVVICVGDFNPLNSEAWHEWWREFRLTLAKVQAKSNADSVLVRDLLSGELVEPLATHLKVKGLAGVGGLGTGDALASFDKSAFQSYGLEQSHNAPMSAQSVACYVGALNHLIDRGQRLANSKICYWYSESVEDDLIGLCIDPDSAAGESVDVNSLIQSIRTGSKPPAIHDRFHCLTVSGSSGRVMVRDWSEGSFTSLRSAVSSWFEDLSIVRRDGAGLASPPKFFALLASLYRDSKDIPSPLTQGLFRTAITGGPIPANILALALDRVRADLVSSDQPGFNHARMGLLKAYHKRKYRGVTVQAYLTKDHPEPAYHCGRLIAVLARLQEAALGEVGAGVVQRFYSATSQNPGLTIGRLLANSQHHLSKLGGGLSHYFESEICEILGQIEGRFPQTLTVEKQSLFALGYYQELAELNRIKAEKSAEKKAKNAEGAGK
jgi:CRISPR-associated protein Csd1